MQATLQLVNLILEIDGCRERNSEKDSQDGHSLRNDVEPKWVRKFLAQIVID